MKGAERFPVPWLGGGIIALIALSSGQAQPTKWPIVRNLHQTRTFANLAQTNTDTPFVAVIRDGGGAAAYKLECHNGNYSDTSEMNFSGDFQCELFGLNSRGKVTENLFVANTPNERSTDWWNRGRLRSEQLRGTCVHYPEYSTGRHFKLRGMRITLQFTDIEWSTRRDQENNALLDGFKLAVDVVSDPTAQSATAEVPTGPKPPRNCYP